MEIIISKQNKVEDVIKHIISTYLNTGTLAKNLPLDHPENASGFELMLLDDKDEESYRPLYESAPLDISKRIGEFGIDTVVFCKAKRQEDSSQLNSQKVHYTLFFIINRH